MTGADLDRRPPSAITELQAVNDVLECATRLDLAAALDTAVDRFHRLTTASSTTILLLQPDGETLEVAAIRYERELHAADWEAKQRARRMRLGEGLVGLAAQRRAPMLIADVEADPRARPLAGSPRWPRAGIIVPLEAEGQLLGVIQAVKRGSGSFNEDHFRVAQTLARCFIELGYVAVRANFRGVGATEGTHDHGEGETDDIVRVAEWALEHYGQTRPVLAGFSFGAFVQTRAAKRITPERMALIGVPNGAVTAERRYASEPVPPDTIVIHGELDKTVPLSHVLDWARPQDLPIVLVPGADHFFHRRLHIIRAIIQGAWQQ